MSMGMGTATRRAAAKLDDFFSPALRGGYQNFIKSLASVIGPE
jgi:hypothetical protein